MHTNQAPVCNCYVAKLPPVDRFSIRFGAHALTCPKYRESRDPVDRAHDEELRARYSVTATCAPEIAGFLDPTGALRKAGLLNTR